MQTFGFQAGCTVPSGHLCLDSDGWRYVRPGSAVEDGFVKDLACYDGTFESEEELRVFSQYSFYLQNVQKGPFKIQRFKVARLMIDTNTQMRHRFSITAREQAANGRKWPNSGLTSANRKMETYILQTMLSTT